MKVLFISAASNIHTIKWVNELSKKGIQIEVVSLKNHDNKNVADKINSDIKVHYLPIEGLKGYIFNIFYLKKLVKKINPDIINVHYASGYGTLGSFLNIENKLLNIWGSDIYIFPKNNLIKKMILKRTLSMYKYIASTSKCMAEEASKYTDKQILITPFGVDTRKFRISKVKEDPDIIIGVVKSLKEIYGIIYLIDAFEILCNKYNKTELYNKLNLEIYGEGELEEELKEEVRNKGLMTKIKFKGRVKNDNLPSVMNKIDIICVPSLSESFGVSALEGMSCKKPVIVSDAPGLKEIVKDRFNGLVVKRGNKFELAERLEELIFNKDLQDELSKNARKFVVEKFDSKLCVDRMLEVYKMIENKKIK